MSVTREELDALAGRVSAVAVAEDEPCVCDTSFTCLARHPDHVAS